MSLQINVEKIEAVLLGGTWHSVEPGSFWLDSYEFGHYVERGLRAGEFRCDMGGGTHTCGLGFCFTDVGTGQEVCGPITEIQAVRGGHLTNLRAGGWLQ